MPGSLPKSTPQGGGLAGTHDGSNLRLAIATARWNAHLTDRLLNGARAAVNDCSVAPCDTVEVAVPGCFELPLVCERLAQTGRFDAVVALGAVIRGETTHYELVSEGAAVGIRQAAARTGVPVIFGVLAVENEQQALDRCLDDRTNKGYEAVLTGIEMATLFRSL